MSTFNFVHGKTNVVTDALSYQVALICQDHHPVNLTQACIAIAQKSDPLWKRVTYFLTSGDTTDTDYFPPNIDNYTLIDEVLYHTTTLKNKYEPNRSVLQLVVPTELIPEVLKLVHDSPIAAHPGKDKCLTQARLQYFWLTMRKDIHVYIDVCHSCTPQKGHTSGHVSFLTYPALGNLSTQ
ncbi:uncharacterized protein LOC143039060 [Oratosquilla oratoria]|uniref:uncharacterized protein LOC143039060 n=1 Tax=Oratosquilla oratoria TaxID=337810 RepID=UPI003F767983